ncbi:epoxide hydrolase [Salix suchowensis]|nr:epoxide hydrolase [Salix suchowensis]
MVNVLTMYMPLLRGLLKLVGVRPQAVEIEPGTVLRFWIPSDDQTTSNASKKPNKPAVVFVHGFALDGILTWQFQVGFQAECVAKGLKKLGVEKCTLVGMSYGGFNGGELHGDGHDRIHQSCCLKRIGFSSWPEYLMPDTVKGVKEMLRIATYKLPWLPDFVHRSILERIHLLWGEEDVIFTKEIARNLKEKLLEGKATLHNVEKAGHVVQLERPSPTTGNSRKFLPL